MPIAYSPFKVHVLSQNSPHVFTQHDFGVMPLSSRTFSIPAKLLPRRFYQIIMIDSGNTESEEENTLQYCLLYMLQFFFIMHVAMVTLVISNLQCIYHC